MNTLNKSSHNCVFNTVRCTTATTGTVHTQRIQQKKPKQQLNGEPSNVQTANSILSYKESIQIYSDTSANEDNSFWNHIR